MFTYQPIKHTFNIPIAVNLKTLISKLMDAAPLHSKTEIIIYNSQFWSTISSQKNIYFMQLKTPVVFTE